jgi:hypothetical protein
MVLPVLDRLRNVVEAENRELARRGPIDYQSHSQRKIQGLLELTRLQGAIAGIRSHPAFSASLADLTAKLEVNERLLGTQLRAARTVSGIVARAIREGQSDGTYSAYPWRDYD